MILVLHIVLQGHGPIIPAILSRLPMLPVQEQ